MKVGDSNHETGMSQGSFELLNYLKVASSLRVLCLSSETLRLVLISI